MLKGMFMLGFPQVGLYTDSYVLLKHSYQSSYAITKIIQRGLVVVFFMVYMVYGIWFMLPMYIKLSIL